MRGRSSTCAYRRRLSTWRKSSSSHSREPAVEVAPLREEMLAVEVATRHEAGVTMIQVAAVAAGVDVVHKVLEEQL